MLMRINLNKHMGDSRLLWTVSHGKVQFTSETVFVLPQAGVITWNLTYL